MPVLQLIPSGSVSDVVDSIEKLHALALSGDLIGFAAALAWRAHRPTAAIRGVVLTRPALLVPTAHQVLTELADLANQQ